MQIDGETNMFCNKRVSYLILLLFFNIFSTLSVQAAIFDDLYGSWIKKSTGEIVHFRKNSIATILPSNKYNDIKSIKYLTCTKYGGNLCFINDQLKCAYRYSFTQGVLNLQYRYTANDNVPVCMSLYGDYTRVDN